MTDSRTAHNGITLERRSAWHKQFNDIYSNNTRLYDI